jgi:hypothetical protein
VPTSDVPIDTNAEAFDVLVECWREMAIADRVALVDQMCVDVEMLAVAGIRRQLPLLSEVQVLHELARRRFGDSLVRCWVNRGRRSTSTWLCA